MARRVVSEARPNLRQCGCCSGGSYAFRGCRRVKPFQRCAWKSRLVGCNPGQFPAYLSAVFVVLAPPTPPLFRRRVERREPPRSAFKWPSRCTTFPSISSSFLILPSSPSHASGSNSPPATHYLHCSSALFARQLTSADASLPLTPAAIRGRCQPRPAASSSCPLLLPLPHPTPPTTHNVCSQARYVLFSHTPSTLPEQC